MKRRMILLTAALLIVSIVLSVYFSNRKKDLLSIEDQLSILNPHEHTASDGTVIKHQHKYEVADLPNNAAKLLKVSDTSHPIQRAWERLDLEYIQQKYQPYNVAEMQEKWSESYRSSFGPNYPHELDEAYPQEAWLQRNLELGQHFADPGDYSTALQRRIYMIEHREEWQVADEEAKKEMRDFLDLPSEVDTWEAYEDAFLKTLITSYHIFQEATASDPSIEGGTVRTDGTFIPFKANTVHVHINPETGLSTFTGVNLTKTEEEDLRVYGVAPEGITVIYTDEKGNPLPADTPTPRFFERNMKELEKAQILLQQQIEEHEFLLEMDTLLTPSEDKKQIVISPRDHGPEKDPDHTHEAPQTDERSPSKQQRQPPNVRQLPPGLEVPPDLHTQDDINRWFTALEALHGGQLPKDLHALQEVITELEKVRQDAEKNLKPPERQEPPAPPVPPEGSSPTPDEAD